MIDAVAEMDLAAFYGDYREDGWGRAAHDPAMMVTLLLYAYAVGERSSRGIERRCCDDVAFRVITANRAPDHATAARFRTRHEDALAGLFGQVLELCAEAGLVRVGVIAVDGTKIHANASREATRSYEEIARELLDEAAAIDAAEDERHGNARGDELPPEFSRAEGRRGWLREAKQRLEQRRAEDAASISGSRSARLTDAKHRLQEELEVERQTNEAYQAYRARGVMKNGRRFGRPPHPYQPPDTPQGTVNVTDPDSRLVRGMRGWLQGYNAQAVCTEQQIVLAAEVTNQSPDFGQLGPLISAARSELAAAGVMDAPSAVVADAGYWHQDQMDDLVGQGIPVLVPPDSSRRKDGRPGWNTGPYAFMRRVLDTEHRRSLYRKRQGMIEPVFAHTKFNRGIDRFQRRGRSAARSEWRLITATHNLQKLHRHRTPD